MAHQTFYIDIDEEITSIVDRLRRSSAREVIIVVPKRAILIQSIVNLKLLKKEADSLKKDLIIVTQDKLGKLLVEKTGIAVQQKLDEIESEEMVPLEINKQEDMVDIEDEFFEDRAEVDAKKRLEMMGSSEYSGGSSRSIEPNIGVKNENAREGDEKKNLQEKIVNRELVTGIGEDIKKSRKNNKGGSLDIIKNMNISQLDADNIQEEDVEDFDSVGFREPEKIPFDRRQSRFESNSNVEFRRENFERFNENEKMEKFFKSRDEFAGRSVYAANNDRKKRKNQADYGKVNLSGKFWKYAAIPVVFAALILAGSATYLFLPKASINIFVKSQSHRIRRRSHPFRGLDKSPRTGIIDSSLKID